jgi:hypothetical protein
MSEVSDLCRIYDVTLKQFPRPITAREDDFSIETNVIVIQGRFTDLLRLLYDLEVRKKLGRVSAATFKTSIDNRSRKTILSLTLYLQNIKV